MNREEQEDYNDFKRIVAGEYDHWMILGVLLWSLGCFVAGFTLALYLR